MRSTMTMQQGKGLLPAAAAAVLALALAGCQQASPTEPIAVTESLAVPAPAPSPAERLRAPDTVEFSGRVERVDLGTNRMIVSAATSSPNTAGNLVVVVTRSARFAPSGLTSLAEIAEALAAGWEVHARGAGDRLLDGSVLAQKLAVRTLPRLPSGR